MIDKLVKNENAYQVEDGSVYFDTGKVKNYPFGICNNDSNYFSNRKLNKSRKESENIKFTSKFGEGQPGWHLECSAICAKHLGRVDIHCGGFDLKHPHHSSSILQSEAYNPENIFGKYWIHFGFLNFKGDVMSKSLGNIIKLEDVKINLSLLRMYFLSKPYYHNFDFCEEEIDTLKTDFINLHLLYNKLFYNLYITSGSQNKNMDLYIYDEIIKVISNNFDVKSGILLLSKYVTKCKKLYLNLETATIILNQLDLVNDLLYILDKNLLEISEDTLQSLSLREQFRKNKNFKESDKIRDSIKKLYIFEDESTGYSLMKKV